MCDNHLAISRRTLWRITYPHVLCPPIVPDSHHSVQATFSCGRMATKSTRPCTPRLRDRRDLTRTCAGAGLVNGRWPSRFVILSVCGWRCRRHAMPCPRWPSPFSVEARFCSSLRSGGKRALWMKRLARVSRCDCASRQRLSVSTAGEMTLRRCDLQAVSSPLLSLSHAFERGCCRNRARQSTKRTVQHTAYLYDKTIHGIEAPEAAARCYTAAPGQTRTSTWHCAEVHVCLSRCGGRWLVT